MKSYFSKCILLYFSLNFCPLVYADTESSDNCTPNGYPINDIIHVEKNLQQALKDHNMNLFAEQFKYSFVVNLGHEGKKRIIKNKQELIDNFSLIYNQDAVNEMLNTKNISHPFCRY